MIPYFVQFSMFLFVWPVIQWNFSLFSRSSDKSDAKNVAIILIQSILLHETWNLHCSSVLLGFFVFIDRLFFFFTYLTFKVEIFRIA